MLSSEILASEPPAVSLTFQLDSFPKYGRERGGRDKEEFVSDAGRYSLRDALPVNGGRLFLTSWSG